MTFKYGERSRRELAGVHPQLVLTAETAIASSTVVDWAVHDGLRRLEEQIEYVRTKVSQTLASKHLKQPDGYGHAIDLVPYVNGKLRWELPLCIEIAKLMGRASIKHDVEIVWGGVWDRQLDELALDSLHDEIEAYAARRRAKGRKAFIDAPHFELFW